MTTLFISDLHLQEERPDITRAFFLFLEQKATEAQQLYILGDFFEVWVGDDGISPFHESIINKLLALSRTCEVFFLHGNRDFLVGEQFADLANLTLLDEPTTITLNSTQTLLLHGDSLCTEDHEYMAFRHTVRSPEWQKQFLDKPLTERIAIAKQLREQSHQQTSQKELYITDVTPTEVIKAMQTHQCPILIHGHTHRPATHHVKTDINNKQGTRVVLGDWGETGWYIEAKEGDIQLVEFTP